MNVHAQFSVASEDEQGAERRKNVLVWGAGWLPTDADVATSSTVEYHLDTGPGASGSPVMDRDFKVVVSRLLDVKRTKKIFNVFFFFDQNLIMYL